MPSSHSHTAAAVAAADQPPAPEPEPEGDSGHSMVDGEEDQAALREYTRYGISLAGLLHFSQMVVALIADEHTTSDVCQTIVKPRTLVALAAIV